MSRFRKELHSLVLAGSPIAPVMRTGCMAHVGMGYRYDPYYHDRHVWDDREIVFCNQWADETHHDRHRDFRKLKKSEQQEYWNWRHNHPDRR